MSWLRVRHTYVGSLHNAGAVECQAFSELALWLER
jgi:hypothetical protein